MEHGDVPAHLNEVTAGVLEAAFEVHTRLGPGLLERVYALCLRRELENAGREVLTEVSVPVVYKGEPIPAGYRLDFLIDHCVIVEVKAVEGLLPVHPAQLRTYLRLTGLPVGLLLNFNVPRLRRGIVRVVNSSSPLHGGVTPP